MSAPQPNPDKLTADPGRWLDDHGDYLFKYAVFRLRDSTAAEDAVQETFLAALKAYTKFEGRGSERTWLVGILKHKITDHFRRVVRETPLGHEEDEGPEHAECAIASKSIGSSAPKARMLPLKLYDKLKHRIRYYLLRHLPPCQQIVATISQSMD